MRKRALSIPGVQKCVMDMERAYQHKSPWRSVYMTVAVVEKAQNSEGVQWNFEISADQILAGDLSPSEVTTDYLKGKNGKIGAVATLLFRSDVKEFLLKSKATELGFPPNVVEAMRDRLMHAPSYRATLKPLDGSVVDLAWRKGWRNSWTLWLSFVEDVVYKTALNSSLKSACKANKSPSEWCDYTSVKERLAGIQEMLMKERADDPVEKSQSEEQQSEKTKVFCLFGHMDMFQSQ